MPLTIVPVQPGKLIGAAVRAGNSGNFTALSFVYGAAWRFTTSLMSDYKIVDTTAFYGGNGFGGPQSKPFGYSRGIGKRAAGILMIGDPHACEALVEATDMVSMNIDTPSIISFGLQAPDPIAALQLRIKFHITKFGSNVAVQKTFDPVAFGTYPGQMIEEWNRTLLVADSGRRDVILFPWQVQMAAWNDSISNHVNTVYSTNTNLHLG